MDLGSLLNQGESNLAIQDLHDLLEEPENHVKLNRISGSSFVYPASSEQTYDYFDVFIQVLLSIQYTDEAYGYQYTKTIVLEALRSCINGILQQYGLSWLIRFPHQLSEKTWALLHANPDSTILIYLYGLILGLAGKPGLVPLQDWCSSLVRFIKSSTAVIVCHIWLNCWAMDDTHDDIMSKVLFMNNLEEALRQSLLDDDDKSSFKRLSECVSEVIWALNAAQVNFLSSSVDQQLGSTLWRPPFSSDEMVLAFSALETAVKKSYLDYPQIADLFYKAKHQQQTSSKRAARCNPLCSGVIQDALPSDSVRRGTLLKKCKALWADHYKSMPPAEFNMCLREAVQHHYPNDRKIMLDILLAEWAVRDPFGCHTQVIMDAIFSMLEQSSRYNMRTAPFYAFIRVFSSSEDDEGSRETTGYNVNTGAALDISQYTRQVDEDVVCGCCEILKILTVHSDKKTKDWTADCLRLASIEIVQWYIAWLTEQLNDENLTEKEDATQFGRHMQAALQNTRVQALSFQVVPILLKTASDQTLAWLIKNSPGCYSVLTSYFGECPQLSTHMLVMYLLQNKSMTFVDTLLQFLRTSMNINRLKSAKSRAWFQNHFTNAMLSVAGDDKSGNGVASRFFRQILKTRGDFDWYLATPFVSEENDQAADNVLQPSDFGLLDIAKTHDVLPVRNIGLVSLLQEMVRLGDSAKSERLVEIWNSLWTTSSGNGDDFTVPFSWILQCIGLYDQAPAVVKQMFERFIRICIQRTMDLLIREQATTEQTYVKRIIDLMMLSDVPDVESVLDLFIQIYDEQSKDEQQRDILDDHTLWSIMATLVEITEELKVEMTASSSTEQQQQQQDTKEYHHQEPTHTTPATPPSPFSTHNNARRLPRALRKRLRGKPYRRWLRRRQKQSKDTAIAALVDMDIDKPSTASPAETVKKTTKTLLILVQRVLNFLLLLFESLEQSIMELDAKQRLRRKLTEWLLFYEPLGALRKLLESHSELADDLQNLIDRCFLSLQDRPAMLLDKARNVLDNCQG